MTNIDKFAKLLGSNGNQDILKEMIDWYEATPASEIEEAYEPALEKAGLDWGHEVVIKDLSRLGAESRNDIENRYIKRGLDASENDDVYRLDGLIKTHFLADELFSLKGDYSELSDAEEVIKAVSIESFKQAIDDAKESADYGSKIVLKAGFSKDGSELDEFSKVLLDILKSCRELFEDDYDYDSWKEDVFIVETFADALFDSEGDLDFLDNWAQDLESVSTTKIIENIIETKEEKGWGSEFSFNVWWDVEESAYPLIKLLQRIKEEASEEQWEEIFGCLKITSNVSVWGGDSWSPRILANGGLVFRNSHRVIAVSDEPESVLNLNNTDLQEYAKLIGDWVAENKDESSLYDWSLLHHGENGIVWTQNIPDALSDYGQTVIMISRDLVEELQEMEEFEDNPIVSSEINDACDNSRSGVAFIRVFNSMSFVHTSFRADDDYDGLIEEYCNYMGESFDEIEVELDATNWNGVSAFCKERAGEIAPDAFSNLEAEDWYEDKYSELFEGLIERMISNVSSRMTQKTNDFPSWFSEDAGAPSFYSGLRPRYQSLLEDVKSRAIVIETNYGGNDVYAFEDVAVYAKNIASDLKSQFGADTAYIDLGLNSDFWNVTYEEEEVMKTVVDIEDEEKVDELTAAVVADLEEALDDEDCETDRDDEEELREFIRYEWEKRFHVILILDDVVNPESIHETSMEFTGDYDNNISVMIPSLGLVQSYDCGDLDSGNVGNFVKVEW